MNSLRRQLKRIEDSIDSSNSTEERLRHINRYNRCIQHMVRRQQKTNRYLSNTVDVLVGIAIAGVVVTVVNLTL